MDKGNQYRIKVPRAETLFLAMESKSETESRMFGWYKGFVLNVMDQCGEIAFVIKKEPSWLHLPGSRQASLKCRQGVGDSKLVNKLTELSYKVNNLSFDSIDFKRPLILFKKR